MQGVQPDCVIGPPSFRGHDHVEMLEEAARAVGVTPILRIVVRGDATGWVSWDDTQRAGPAATRPIDPDTPAIVGFTSGTTSGAKGAVVSTRSMLTVPTRHARGAVHVSRPRVHARAGVAHHRSAHGGDAPVGVGVFGAAGRAVGRGEGRRRHRAPPGHVLGRGGGVHPGARRRGRGRRAARAAARMWVQLRWERDPVRAGAAVRGTGHEAASRLRDDRVPDRLRQHGRRRPRDPTPHRRADPPRRRRARRGHRRVRRGGRRGGGVPRARPPTAPLGTWTRRTPATGSTPTAGSAAATSGSSTPSSASR